MNINQRLTVPSALESARFFADLPAVENNSRVYAPQVMTLSAQPQSRVLSNSLGIMTLADQPGGGIDLDNQAEVNTDSPVIIAFDDNVSEENREAVMLGVEFAETVANSRVDIDQDPIGYLREYSTAFRHAGWLTTGGHEFSEYTSRDRSLTMDSVVLDLLGSIAGPNKAAIIQLLSLTLDKLQKNEPLLQLFESNSRKAQTGNFRLIPCLQSRRGTPITYLLSMHVTFSKSTGGALFWKWSVSNLHIQRLAKGVQFNKRTFERNEGAIYEYLGDSADKYFEGLK